MGHVVTKVRLKHPRAYTAGLSRLVGLRGVGDSSLHVGDAPIYNPSLHTSLFYDDFSSYATGVASDMFDGSGDNTWIAGIGDAGPDSSPDDARRTIATGTGGGQEASLYGGKYLRLDYTAAGPIRVATALKKSNGNFPDTTAYSSYVITMSLRCVGKVFFSKHFEWYGSNGATRADRWVMEYQRASENTETRSCWWTGTYPYPPLDGLCGASGTPQWNWGHMLSHAYPSYGNRGLQTNCGGPCYDRACGGESHPNELGDGATPVITSSGEWWRYTIRVTRESGSPGTGKIEMWITGTNPNGEGRITTARKVLDYDGTVGNCEAGKVYTAPSGEHFLEECWLGGTTDGNGWNEDPPYTNGAYLDWDYVRFWTEG